MRELTDHEERVLEAVASLETAGTPGFVDDVAEAAGVDVADARAALSALTRGHNLVQEVSTGAGDDPGLGPRYRVKARP